MDLTISALLTFVTLINSYQHFTFVEFDLHIW